MRLANLLRFEFWLNKDAQEGFRHQQPKQYRLVIYAVEQQSPVYISEQFTLGQASLCLNEVSFQNITCSRSFCIAIQLLSSHDNKPNWKLEKQWLVDLRQVKPQPTLRTKMDASLIIHTDSGFLVVPYDGSPPNLGSRQSSTESSSTEPNHKSITSTQSAANDSVLSRWLPWPKPLANDVPSKDRERNTKLTSLSYAALVDLWTLQHSLDEARAASKDLEKQLNTLIPSSSLELNEKRVALIKRKSRILRRTQVVRSETETDRNQVTRILYISKSQASKLAESSDQVRDVLKENTTRLKLPRSDVSAQIKREQSRLAAELLEIFPIDLVGDGKFHFRINGLLLPSVFAINHYDNVQTGAALGFVAQVVVCLSRYLDIALPYPINFYGSQSYITDNISRIKHGSNKFPLWTRGALLYRVEYALYLLHKDIEQLMTALGLAVVDLKHTLANLKNVLLVMSTEAPQDD